LTGATNLVVAIEGETKTYMIEENGARVVKSTLTPGKMTIFPAASLHSMQNTGCENATLISALNSADTGTNNFINSLFQLPRDMVKAGFGGVDLDFDKIDKNIPPVGTGSILGSAECRKRCGI
jgi:oxalate decarboxylase/phosphoglucose isomerase-like protein (cupin superfamily)